MFKEPSKTRFKKPGRLRWVRDVEEGWKIADHCKDFFIISLQDKRVLGYRSLKILDNWRETAGDRQEGRHTGHSESYSTDAN